MPQIQAQQAPPVIAGIPAATQTPAPSRTQIRKQQAVAQNSWPSAHLQVTTGFRLCRAIDAAAEEGAEIPISDNRRHFCLSCHLKGVCN